MEVQHRPRIHGQSNYGVERFVKGLLDLLTVRVLTLFGERPLHFLGGCGSHRLCRRLFGIGLSCLALGDGSSPDWYSSGVDLFGSVALAGCTDDVCRHSSGADCFQTGW